MSDKGRSRSEREARANRIFVAAVGGLILAVVIVVFVATMHPYVARTAPADVAAEPTPSQPAVVAAQPTAATSSAAGAASTTPAASATPAPTAPAEKTTPERMARLVPGSSQMIVVTAPHLGSNLGTLSVFNLDSGRWSEVMSVPSRLGTYGLFDGEKRVQGSRTTPTGIWKIGDYVFGQHPSPPAGTLMPYHAITDDSWWSAKRDSTYNHWVETSKPISGERLRDATIQYEFAFSSGYNEAPKNESVQGRGTAIFIHVFDPMNYHHGFTAGCISVSRDNMLRLFRTIDPARVPVCAVGTLQKGTSTSIYAY